MAASFRQGMPGRGRKSQISNLKFQISNFKSEISDLKSSIFFQPITGHFRQKGARRHLPEPVNQTGISNLKSQISNLKSEIPERCHLLQTEKPGAQSPLLPTPGRGNASSAAIG
jgi:hypothetical protein